MAFIVAKSPDQIVSTRNPVGFKITADASWDTFDDYYILIRLEYENVYKSGIWTDLVTVRTTPEPDGTITVDFQGRLEQIVEPDQPNPDILDGIICTKIQKRFRVYMEEYQDGVGQGEILNGIRYAVRAGMAFRSDETLWQWIVSNKALTHASRSREITVNFPAWMYFSLSVGTATVYLKAEITFDDDTTSTVTLFTLTGTGLYDIVCFPVGYQQTGMHTQPKQVKSYEFWIEDSGNNEISDRHIYHLRRKCSSLDRYYLFENSFGGFDTLHTRGKSKTGFNVQSQNTEVYLSPFYSLSQRANLVYQTESNHSVEQYIGFSRKDEVLWLRDLLRSEWAFRIGDLSPTMSYSTELYPIEIERGKSDILEDNVFLSELKFTYTDEKSRGL